MNNTQEFYFATAMQFRRSGFKWQKHLTIMISVVEMNLKQKLKSHNIAHQQLSSKSNQQS